MTEYILLVWDQYPENTKLYLFPRLEISEDHFHLLNFASMKYFSIKDEEDAVRSFLVLLDTEWEKYLVTLEMLRLSGNQHIERVILSGYIITEQKNSYGSHWV
jgi:hypothetical protein